MTPPTLELTDDLSGTPVTSIITPSGLTPAPVTPRKRKRAKGSTLPTSYVSVSSEQVKDDTEEYELGKIKEGRNACIRRIKIKEYFLTLESLLAKSFYILGFSKLKIDIYK
ncbi:hypothetical protein L209DRAFT_742276 [Thermothelomyces heterothallicus CBS 203.75]